MFRERVFSACRRIPAGRVAAYAEVARATGSPKSARAVGNVLNKNRLSSVPCHRVIRSDGRVGGFVHGTGKKAAMLRAEGVVISCGRVAARFFCRL